MGTKKVIFIGIVFLSQHFAISAPLWKKDRPTNELIKNLGKKRFEEATGAKLYLINRKLSPPANPTKVPGTFLHYDGEGLPDSDNKYVVGDHNPIVNWENLKKSLYKKLANEGIKDINDKWDEFKFLKLISPEMAPPDTHLVSEFIDQPLWTEKMEEISKQADEAMKKFNLTGKEFRDKLIRLEVLRQNIQPLGRTILKERVSCHSEGRLPISDKNWMEIYAGYEAVTKPALVKLQKETEFGGGSFKDLRVRLPYFEGKVLETILENPEEVVTQNMVKIKREVRIHIADGKLLHPNASFLRFYHLNEFLSETERKEIYDAVNEKFLSKLKEKLGPDLKKLYATADVVITEDGKMRIIDFNQGFDSGYYNEHTDIFTANYVSHFFNGGKNTPLLEEYTKMSKLPVGDVSAREMGRMFRKYTPFLFGLQKKDRKFIDEEVERAFWDRMIISYEHKLKRNATPEAFERALQDFRQAGLRNPHVYLQFVAQIQESVKDKNTLQPLRLAPEAQKFWQEYIGERGKHLDIIIDDNKLSGKEKPEPVIAPCVSSLGKVTS